MHSWVAGQRLAITGLLSLCLGACAVTGLPPELQAQVDANPTIVAATVQPLPETTPPAATHSDPTTASAVQALDDVVPTTAAPQGDQEVISAPVAIDPLQPDVRINPNDHVTQADLWDRVRGGFGLPDLEGDLVRSQERWYAARPDYVQRMTERGGRYLFHILQELERRGLPSELALLPFIESAFNPEAMSSARASGMWQFMPATGRNFALKQNVFRDDRRDVLASTRAALDYLQLLHRRFGDWHLALAAYNWGEGNVSRAIAQNRRVGKATDYASLKMPNETRYYVPKLQAVKNIVARPQGYGLVLPALANHPFFLSVPIERDIDVELAASLAGLTVEAFRTLNPQMNKPVILAAGTPQVLLPYDNANRFVQELPKHRGRLASWTAWVAPKTLKPAEAARQVGMDEAALRELNVIPQRMLIQAGSTLLVPRSEQRLTDVSVQLADHAMVAFAPDGPQLKRMSLRAGQRDSVTSIARRFGVRPDDVAQWNSLGASSSFRAGQTVIVFVPARALRTRTAAAVRASHPSKPASAHRASATSNRTRLAKR
jgi:membrane-bound lytic murein transglycosylase D